MPLLAVAFSRVGWKVYLNEARSDTDGADDGRDVGPVEAAVLIVFRSVVEEELALEGTVSSTAVVSRGAEQSYGKLLKLIYMTSISHHSSHFSKNSQLVEEADLGNLESIWCDLMDLWLKNWIGGF